MDPLEKGVLAKFTGKHLCSSLFLNNVYKQTFTMFFKIIVLKKFVNFTVNTCLGVFFDKVAGPQNSNFNKKTPTQIFPAKLAKSPALASACLRFPLCNFVKKETPAKMFFL